VLAAWHHQSSSPVLVGLAPGTHQGHDRWAGFLEELTGRGLRAPLLVITDGAPGLIGAVQVVFAHSLRQRCVIHRCRNVLAKVPTHAQDEVKAAFWRSSTTSLPTLESRGSIHHTNLIQRTFAETRRRTKVIGRLPGKRNCLSLVWAVLDRASRGWRGVGMTPTTARLLHASPRALRPTAFPPEAGRRPQRFD
jgi:putative transposase